MVNMSTVEMIQANGYLAETHQVETQDGYKLQLHRIPYGRSSLSSCSPSPSSPSSSKCSPPPSSFTSRPPVLLHHCLLCSSSDFVMNSPDKALAYVLADAGYDVWLTNARGNTYSRAHATLTPDQKEFWEFSWHEMGMYDLPAAIDYVLDTTSKPTLDYVGFSMGTTVFWVMLSERPDYAEKVNVMVAMGPVAFVQHVQGPLRFAAPFVNIIERSLSMAGRYEMLSFGSFMDRMLSVFCDERALTAAICHNLLFLVAGPNPTRLNKSFLPVLLAHTPAGTSVRTVTHFLQLINSGTFRQYDFGHFSNLAHYGSLTPPDYNLSRVACPVGLFWSPADWLATPEDVKRLETHLPNLVQSKAVQDDAFSHLDFVWASDAEELVYRDVLKFLKSFH